MEPTKHLLAALAALTTSIALSGCSNNSSPDTIRFATCADYPPFEYISEKKFNGFDIELAKCIAQELGKEAVFIDMQFSVLLPALQTEKADAAISTITITPERSQNFDFSRPYYTESLSLVYKQQLPITASAHLKGKRVACQLGTAMELWLKKHAPDTTLITLDNNNQAIESLKADRVDGVLVDTAQSIAFAKQNEGLGHATIAISDNGYAIAYKKGSPLKSVIDPILAKLEKDGTLSRLKKQFGLE